MRRLIPILLISLAGCASAWKATYTGGAVTSQFVTDTHRIAWSEPMRERTQECNDKLDPEVNTKADFDACTDPYTASGNAKITNALRIYNAAADVLAEALLATDPSKPNKAELVKAWGDVLSAALDLVRLFPEAEKYVNQLELLTKGLGR